MGRLERGQDDRLATGQLNSGPTNEESETFDAAQTQRKRTETDEDSAQKISTTATRNNQVNKHRDGFAESTSELDKTLPVNCLRWWQRTRIHVALLGLAIAVVNCYAQATFCIAIVEMVLPADYVDARTSSASNSSSSELAASQTIATLSDQSCPIEFKYRNYYDSWRFDPDSSLATDNQRGRTSEQVVVTSNRFNWDASQQGLLLGAFAVGTAPLQIIGGRMAEIYGSKWVLLMACIGTGLTNLAIPQLARFNLMLLIANRILMGVAQAGMEPGLMCLLADWLTPQEAGFFISMLLCALCLGFFLGSLCSSSLLALGYGWPLTYYVCGGLNLAVALVWYLYADSWPRASRHISREELRYIEQEQSAARGRAGGRGPDVGSQTTLVQAPTGQTGAMEPAVQEDPLKAPWLNLLSSRPVWAFIICKISIRWCADVISNELPTYLANVLHLSIKINGLLNSVSCALFAISSFLTGWLATSNLFNAPAKVCCSPRHSTETIHDNNKRRRLDTELECAECRRNQQEANLSKTNLRKCFQSAASFGSAICLILMTRYDCDIVISMSCLLLLSWFIVMGTGGELQIAYDMTSRYPGTLHGMACTLSVSGWLAPPLYGLVLGDQPSSRARWSLVWYSTAAINLLGGLIFVLFADASPQDFDRSRKRRSRGEGAADPERAERDASYCNAALSGSSCESSPKSTHHQPSQQQSSSGKLAAFRPTFTTFDCDQPIRCRQLESSLMRAKPLGARLDSPLQLEVADLIHPYCEQQPHWNGANSSETSIWQRLAGLVTRTDQTKLNCDLAAGQLSGRKSIRQLANGHHETINQSRGSHEGHQNVRPSLGANKPPAGEPLDGRHSGAGQLADGVGQLTEAVPAAGPDCKTSTDDEATGRGQSSNTVWETEAQRQKTITHL